MSANRLMGQALPQFHALHAPALVHVVE